MTGKAIRLLALMAVQRDALLTGNIAALPQIVGALDRLLAGVGDGDFTAAQQGRIAAEARRNAALLAAACKGVATVKASLRQNTGAPFGGYDAKGQRTRFATDGQTLLARR